MNYQKNMILDRISEEIEESSYELHSMSELQDWLSDRNKNLNVAIEMIDLEHCDPWFYDESEGSIHNRNNSFFSITGIRQFDSLGKIIEQPIIIQNEIGFLGIITCKISGTWHYLMQAKIEPGNVNVVQISPTLQATKSNFTGAHGGTIPKYLNQFMEMKAENIIVDQIQSEQSSRFLGKRNRNVILRVNEVLSESDTHRWMTLGQIKEFMKQDNMVNMDTRTVLSCIPYVLLKQDADVPFKNKSYFYNTAWNLNRKTIVELYHGINDYKMLYKRNTELIALTELATWHMRDKEFVCDDNSPFKIVFCDITIEGREVTHWKQPLFASNGMAIFGLVCCDDNGVIKFLVKIRPEIGCFDYVEIGPTIQHEYSDSKEPFDPIEHIFFSRINERKGIMVDCVLSEEGGRFYQEQNRNVILMVDKDEIGESHPGYTWSDYGTLNILTQVNNCVNIQLRNLLSLLEL